MGTRSVIGWFVAAAIVGGGLAGCSSSSGDGASGSDGGPAKATTSTTAVAGGDDTVPGKAWDVVEPADADMDAAKLDEAKQYAFQDGKNTQGVVVVRDGEIVAEWYAPGADQDSWTASWSVAKSFSSALVGIAIEEGKIPSVDEPMTTYLPEWKGTDKEDITLEDVLHMSSGLEWNEEYDPDSAKTSDVVQMGLSQDELAYVVDRPVAEPAGSKWLYSSGDAMLISEVIAKATGMSAGEYAQEKLFAPIQMEKADWWQDAVGHTLGYCCFDATARAYARFGQLYLDEGAWGGEQVIPASWVEDSVEDAPGKHPGYGYMWWLDGLDDVDGIPKDTYSADGHDGQFIYVVPSLDLVVVRTGTYVKDPGPSVADPTLFGKYPPDDLVPGKGTIPPDSWDTTAFLGPIVESVQD